MAYQDPKWSDPDVLFGCAFIVSIILGCLLGIVALAFCFIEFIKIAL